MSEDLLLDDPCRVLVGDLVVLEVDTALIRRFVLVDDPEPTQSDRVSVRSPLARAILGRHVGEVVDVDAAARPYRVRVLGAIRPPSSWG